MSFDYLAGLAANLATTATITTTQSTEDANYVAGNAGVGWPAQSFRFNAAVANNTLDFDLGSAKSPTMISVHGHNIDSGTSSITILSDSNSDYSTQTNEGTITSPATPTFFKLLSSPSSNRFWRLRFNGTNGNPIEIGEVGIGVHQSLTHTQLADWEYVDDQPQTRQTGGNVPQDFASNLTDHPQRMVQLTLLAESYTERNEIRDNLFVNTKRGEEPLIFIPDADDEIVIHGRVPKRIPWKRSPGPNGGYHRATFTIREDPFSIALP